MRIVSIAEAVAGIRSGQQVYIHCAAATPSVLLDALVARAHELRDVGMIHLHTSRRYAASGQAAPSPAWASPPASSRSLTTPSRPASGDNRIVTTLCPGGKERMRRLMAMVQSGRFDPLPLITHGFALDDIVGAYDLFSNRRDGVLEVAVRP